LRASPDGRIAFGAKNVVVVTSTDFDEAASEAGEPSIFFY
jgi:hypothetical protein